MVVAPAITKRNIRRLGAADVDRVIAIDRAYSGQSRRRFFERRFAAAKKRPEDFIYIGVIQDGLLCGFAIARVLRGEFGHEHAVAVLDAIGVAAECRGQGIGQALLGELKGAMRQRGVLALQSQADWTNHDLMRFFDAAGFKLAPRLVLQRPVAALFDKPNEEV